MDHTGSYALKGYNPYNLDLGYNREVIRKMDMRITFHNMLIKSLVARIYYIKSGSRKIKDRIDHAIWGGYDMYKAHQDIIPDTQKTLDNYQ